MRFPLSLARKIISAYRLDESVDTRLGSTQHTVRYIIGFARWILLPPTSDNFNI